MQLAGGDCLLFLPPPSSVEASPPPPPLPDSESDGGRGGGELVFELQRLCFPLIKELVEFYCSKTREGKGGGGGMDHGGGVV